MWSVQISSLHNSSVLHYMWLQAPIREQPLLHCLVALDPHYLSCFLLGMFLFFFSMRQYGRWFCKKFLSLGVAIFQEHPHWYVLAFFFFFWQQNGNRIEIGRRAYSFFAPHPGGKQSSSLSPIVLATLAVWFCPSLGKGRSPLLWLCWVSCLLEGKPQKLTAELPLQRGHCAGNTRLGIPGNFLLDWSSNSSLAETRCSTSYVSLDFWGWAHVFKAVSRNNPALPNRDYVLSLGVWEKVEWDVCDFVSWSYVS